MQRKLPLCVKTELFRGSVKISNGTELHARYSTTPLVFSGPGPNSGDSCLQTLLVNYLLLTQRLLLIEKRQSGEGVIVKQINLHT